MNLSALRASLSPYRSWCLTLGLGAAAIAATSFAGSNVAMDSKTMVEPMAPPAPLCDWSGFYAGIHGGWSHYEYRPDLKGDFADFSLSLPDSTLEDDTFALGAQLGYNWQVRSFVFGMEADGSWINADTYNRRLDIGENNNFYHESGEMDWFGTVRGRAGFAVQNLLIYVTGGAAFADGQRSTRYEEELELGVAEELNTWDAEDFRFGWTVGGGAEGTPLGAIGASGSNRSTRTSAMGMPLRSRPVLRGWKRKTISGWSASALTTGSAAAKKRRSRSATSEQPGASPAVFLPAFKRDCSSAMESFASTASAPAWRWALILCVPVVSLLVATRQIYLSNWHDLSTWKGGGMGMFAGADNTSTRYTKIYVVDPVGNRHPLTRFAPSHTQFLGRALNYPTRARLSPRRPRHRRDGLGGRKQTDAGGPDRCPRRKRRARRRIVSHDDPVWPATAGGAVEMGGGG